MFVLGPLFLIVTAFNTQYKSLYLIVFFISLCVFLNLMYELIKEKKPLTFGRLIYLLICIPLLMHISIMQENSNLYARYLLLLFVLIYIIYNIDVVCFHILPKNDTINGFPSHPMRRLLPLLQ